MDFRFNYGFLKEFMRKNKLQKKDLLSALGTKDYTSVNRWLNGETPIHINAMLRFCNFYNVPLCSFFFDNDGMPATFEPKMPEPDALTKASGKGYAHAIEVEVTERNADNYNQQKAIDLGLKVREQQLKRREPMLNYQFSEETEEVVDDKVAEPLVMTVSAENPSHDETYLRMKLNFMNELREIEAGYRKREEEMARRFEEERSRMLSIIERMQSK